MGVSSWNLYPILCRGLYHLVLTEGLEIARTTKDRFDEAELYRLKGELLLQPTVSRPQAEAEECFR
jgi:hypothetical protein